MRGAEEGRCLVETGYIQRITSSVIHFGPISLAFQVRGQPYNGRRVTALASETFLFTLRILSHSIGLGLVV